MVYQRKNQYEHAYEAVLGLAASLRRSEIPVAVHPFGVAVHPFGVDRASPALCEEVFTNANLFHIDAINGDAMIWFDFNSGPFAIIENAVTEVRS
jgi:hypothetical protein